MKTFFGRFVLQKTTKRLMSRFQLKVTFITSQTTIEKRDFSHEFRISLQTTNREINSRYQRPLIRKIWKITAKCLRKCWQREVTEITKYFLLASYSDLLSKTNHPQHVSTFATRTSCSQIGYFPGMKLIFHIFTSPFLKLTNMSLNRLKIHSVKKLREGKRTQ